MQAISWRTALRGVRTPTLILGACALGLQFGYLVFHVLAEGFSIVIALSALTVAATSRQFTKDRFMIYIAIGIGWCAVLDVVHTLAFKGMGLLPVDGANTATQLWIAARYLQAAVMISAPLFLRRSVRTGYLNAGFGLLVAAVLVLIATGAFPDAYLEDQGLTPFKIYSEYAIILMLVATLILLWRRRTLLAQPVWVAISGALVAMILAEFAFTRYVSVYATANLIGHLFKIIAYWFIYVALVRWTLREPFRMLAEQQIFLDNVVENIPNMIFVKDAQTLRFVRFNKAGEHLLGYPREELLGKNDYDFFPKAEADLFTAKDREVLAQKRLIDIPQETVKTKVQGERILHTKKIPILNEDGKPQYLLGISEDITVRVRAEESSRLSEQALRESEFRWHFAVEGSGDGLWDWNLVDNTLFLTKRWKEMLGYTEDEIGTNISEWEKRIHPEDKAQAVTAVQRYLAGESPNYLTEHRVQCKDGSYKWILDRGVVVSRSADGKPLRMIGTYSDITQRKQAAGLLRASETRSHTIIQTALDGFWLTDLRGHLLQVNAAYCRMSGYSEQELLAKSISDLEAREQSAETADHMQVVIAQGSDRFETRHRRKDGSTFDVDVSVQYQPVEGDRVVCFLSDITERKQAELAVRESERRYRQMVENSPDVVYSYSMTKGGIYYSPKVFEVLGYSAEHLRKNPFLWTESIHPEDRPAVAKAVDEFRKGTAFKIEYRIKNASDEWRWLFDRSSGIREEDGDRIVDGLAMDITESKRGREVLKVSEERSRTIIQTALDGFALTDLEGRLLEVNEAYCRMTGYSEQELLTKHISDLASSHSAIEIAAHMQAIVTQGSDRFQTRHGRKDGSVFDVEISIQYQAVEGGRMVTFLTDITERMQIEQREHEVASRVERAMFGTIGAVSRMMDLRDPYTSGHERRVGEISAAIAAEMGLDENIQRGLRVAGNLHDVGKITVPAEILSKPGKLTALEYEMIKGHAAQGYEVLKDIDFPWPVAEVARQHHERIDGSGYPRGLRGQEIVLEARILAVADVIEAMASHRPYRPGIGIEKAVAEIEQGRGTVYDTSVADACLRMFRDKGYSIPD